MNVERTDDLAQESKHRIISMLQMWHANSYLLLAGLSLNTGNPQTTKGQAMKRKLLLIPAILLPLLAIAPAQAKPATSLKEVTVGNERVVELTNEGQLTLKIVARPGYDRAGEHDRTDNGIVEAYVAPGKSVLIKGPYNVYEYIATPAKPDPAMYLGGS